MSKGKNCAVCKGKGEIEIIDSECPYCNGTGEYNKLAEHYLKNHVCQCIFTDDRKMCPLCGNRCHHDSHQRPHILVGPAQGG